MVLRTSGSLDQPVKMGSSPQPLPARSPDGAGPVPSPSSRKGAGLAPRPGLGAEWGRWGWVGLGGGWRGWVGQGEAGVVNNHSEIGCVLTL